MQHKLSRLFRQTRNRAPSWVCACSALVRHLGHVSDQRFKLRVDSFERVERVLKVGVAVRIVDHRKPAESSWVLQRAQAAKLPQAALVVIHS